MKFLNIIIMCIALCSCGLVSAQSATANMPKILILQVADHPAIQQTTQGIIDTLKAKGYVPGENLILRVESAQANSATAMQITNKFIAQEPSVVVGVGTMAAQGFVKYTQANRIKLIFSSVTDPVSAKLASANDNNMRNISGISNFVPMQPQVELMKVLQPNLKSIGIIYNPGEIKSVKIVQQLEHVCNSMHIKLQKQAITKTTDAVQATKKLAASTDAVFICNDNTALSSLQSIVLAAMQGKVPVYVSDTDAVALGALAALGPNQYALGQQTGAMIVKVLEGADINALPIELPAQTELVINAAVAKKLGIDIPSSIAAKAKIIGKPA